MVSPRMAAALALALLLSCFDAIQACDDLSLMQQALSSDAAQSKAAVSALRNLGPASLETLFHERDAAQKQANAAANLGPEQAALLERVARLNGLIDSVGGARYCSISRLYWHTNLAEAQRLATAQNKPILSLRMLGQLTEEFSCANSRFFRATLYSNAEIAQYLREHFILHWESVRPVPKITIDFGDGRRVERTITGNSAHYMLTSAGRPVEVLPGLYGPQDFLEWLRRAEGVAKLYAQSDVDNREWFLRQYHAAQRDAITRQWQADLARVAPGNGAARLGQVASAKTVAAAPRAEKAAKLAVGKGRVEIPLLKAMAVNAKLLEQSTDDARWEKIAALHLPNVKFDDATLAVMRDENPTALSAGSRAMTKFRVEDPLVKMVRNLTTSVALDAVRNEYLLHRQIHEWFASGAAPAEVSPLNERVYAELFLTPSSDPWLGLIPADTYTALEQGGLSVPEVAHK